ncbi:MULTISPECIES: hypothetical protein [Bradyrhizobium]|uniref:hypothetical protein n=1 Tax=Bradyrhizobium TaxID=374 RepID=UPI001AEE04CC|nr:MULTISPECIES: hypothetical protein [Bradyrhizobium]MCK7665245.1 hypothetical protein [Bradyrhizobium sp. 2S1]UGY12543.1 hypothetical protein HAP48_0028430 [Bradyrhizobium septentrionale]UGY21539.1 hypothetical protein HU675_0026315 [Bradyrhizobium septentrionale]
MHYTALQQNRFLVRRGSGDDWMVYDRELKGPAQPKKNGPFAEKLTKDQAQQLMQMLTDDLTGAMKAV